MTTLATETRRLWFGDSLAEIKVSKDDGDGTHSVIEMTVPDGAMSPLHVHDEDETFHVMDGSVTLFVGDEAVHAEAGSTVRAPKGIPHAYRVGSPGGARWLVITSPGRFEDFVRGAGRPANVARVPPATDGRPSPAQLARIAAAAGKSGIEILGPPGMLPSDL